MVIHACLAPIASPITAEPFLLFNLWLLEFFFCIPGTAIFFEFKHYKPKKDIVSTRCFAFMEQDELKPGSACIEL